MYAVVLFAEVLNVYPHMPVWVVYLMTGICAYNILFMTITVCTDPGYLKNDNVDFLYLLEVSDPTHLCPDCLTVRTSRSKHCSVCQRCVERFDHHCPWINNCVGANNHNYFFQFVVSMFLVIAQALSHAIYVLVEVSVNGYRDVNYWSEWVHIPAWAFFILISVQLAITGLFFFPMLWLTGTHVKNFINNKTTLERLSRYQASS